jgi:hypothetical protein
MRPTTKTSDPGGGASPGLAILDREAAVHLRLPLRERAHERIEGRKPGSVDVDQ